MTKLICLITQWLNPVMQGFTACFQLQWGFCSLSPSLPSRTLWLFRADHYIFSLRELIIRISVYHVLSIVRILEQHCTFGLQALVFASAGSRSNFEKQDLSSRYLPANIMNNNFNFGVKFIPTPPIPQPVQVGSTFIGLSRFVYWYMCFLLIIKIS